MSRFFVLVIAVAIGVSGCGIPLDESPQVVAAEDLPVPLQPGTSTTTTTPDTVQTERLTIYLVDPGDGEPTLEPVTREVPIVEAGADNARVALEQLIAGPTSEEQLEANLSTSIVSTGDQPIEVVETRREVAGQLVVVLSQNPGLEGRAGIVSFGQIVFTVTELDGLDSVRFLIVNADGVEEDIPVRTDTTEGDVRRPVGRDDYTSLLA